VLQNRLSLHIEKLENAGNGVRFKLTFGLSVQEVYVKALGKGISKAPLKEFTFTFDASSPTVLRNLKQAVTIPICAQARTISLKVSALSRAVDNSDDAWQFLLLQPSASHYASICTQILPSSTFGTVSSPLQ
jgi:hypothetical protein